ncbi:MAG TPA: hypothetical protein VFS43_27890 [Polyangiaceae bacterium]|nr:hypothetical protein [Polyangiaceae bacterium]
MPALAPAAVTCPHYAPPPGERQCRHYLLNGACDRPDEFMCVEWLKANGHRAPAGADGLAANGPAASGPAVSGVDDAAGAPPPADRFPPRWLSLFDQAPPRLGSSPRLARGRPASPAPPPAAPPPPTAPPPASLASAEDVATLAERYAATQLETDELGPVWIVAEPTGADRLELTYRDAAALAAVCAAFPGARVVALERAPKKST